MYRAFGLNITSELALPELHPAPAGAAPDASVRVGRILEPAESAASNGCVIDFAVPETGRYRIEDGRRILVEPEPGAAERNVRLFVLGSAFGALLHQRGVLPVHANAVDIDGKVVAFAGASGAGKSTLAAWFQDRGRPLLSDDVCALSAGADGAIVVRPGIPRLRLWRDALERSGRSPLSYERSLDREEPYDKYDVPANAIRDVGEPRQLAAIYFLGPPENELRIAPVSGFAALTLLRGHTYRPHFAASDETKRDQWELCGRILRSVPTFEVHRTWGPDHFDEQAAQIEQHCLAAIRG